MDVVQQFGAIQSIACTGKNLSAAALADEGLLDLAKPEGCLADAGECDRAAGDVSVAVGGQEHGTSGHGGAGNSYCWADPDSGVSFAYLTNCRIPDPWHSVRLDLVSNFVHSAIV